MAIKIPDSIQRLVPYVPGKPIEETKREFGLKKVVKLASNENALGPSPRAVKAIRTGFKELHRYPDPQAFSLRTKLAKFLNVQFNQILVGNGSDDVIDLIVRSFTVPGDAVLFSKTAFSAYKVCAHTNGVETVELEDDAETLLPPLPQMLERVKKDERIKIIFLANPNNPTGTYVKNAELVAFLEEVKKVRGGSVLVALDYAYWEYVDATDLTPPEKLFPKFQNVMILRTFSKIYGLAGIRMGYVVGDSELLSFVARARQPFTNNNLSLVAAEAALTDRQFVRKSFRVNLRERAKWEAFLKKNGIPYWKSQTNFLLIDTQRGFGKSGVEIYQASLQKGVIFRPVANYGLHHALRVSIGTAAENVFAMKILKAIKANGKN